MKLKQSSKNGRKKLLIINGVMGVIGSPVFSYFSALDDYVVWGVSRQGKYYEEYLNESNKLPDANMVFSLGDYYSDKSQIAIGSFVNTVDYDSVTFIHAMGKFVTEIDKDGQLAIEDDVDKDGINDSVKQLSYNIPLSFVNEFLAQNKQINFIQIGSLSDKHNIELHGSWVKSMNLLKEDLVKISNSNPNLNALILNVSSVLTPKELIERPFVSVQTDAEMQYWLPPIDIAVCIDEHVKGPTKGYSEKELYKIWPNFSKKHYTLDEYKERRKSELFSSSQEGYEGILDMEDGDSVSYEFSNPLHLDKLWGDLTLLLFSHHNKHNENQVILYYNPRVWFFLLRENTEKLVFSTIHENGGLVLLSCGYESDVDKGNLEKMFSQLRHEYLIGDSHSFDNNYNLNIYGDFIIEVKFDEEVSSKIDDYYNTNDSFNLESIKDLEKIVSSKGKNTITIHRNIELANQHRDKLSQGFQAPDGFHV